MNFPSGKRELYHSKIMYIRIRVPNEIAKNAADCVKESFRHNQISSYEGEQ